VIEIVNKLTQLRGPGFLEVFEEHTFRCYRRDKDGNLQKVTLTVLDAGPNGDSDLRYQVLATTAEGYVASGNPDATLDAALAIVHWENLDRDPGVE
jgi:hypothetical protein